MRVVAGCCVVIGVCGALASGCTYEGSARGPAVVTASGSVTTSGAPSVYSEPPELVSIEPDVYVVEDAEYPVYFTGDAYWSYRGGVWYEAPYWDAPWVEVSYGIVPANLI